MIDECPHCYGRVIASSSGECPSCRKNIHDRTGTDSTKTTVLVAHGTMLPPYCCDCGKPTDRRVKVKSTVGGPGGRDWGFLAVLLFPFSMILSLVLSAVARSEQMSRRSNDVAVVKMPQCKACGSLRRPSPTRVDTEQLRLTFVVHRDFEKKVSGSA